MRIKAAVFATLSTVGFAMACAVSSGGGGGSSVRAGDKEPWDSANNPANIDASFEYRADALPLSGHGPEPIPGDYWAVARDSLNARWNGPESLSPAEKYAMAFNRPQVPDLVSLANGVDSQPGRKSCKTDADCNTDPESYSDDGKCSIRFGREDGRCIPTWFGICHGWAPYAISEPMAVKPVVRKALDGTEIIFYPGDIEGLMSMMYTRLGRTEFLSARCNKDESKIKIDDSGRILDGECRDMNAGSFHVLATNMMGLRGKGFVIDQTWDDEVWNQPAYGYEIKNAENGKLKEISKAQAASLLGADMRMDALLATTKIKKGEQKIGEYTASADAEYTIKLTGNGDVDLYVKKGEAASSSAYDCRPYTGTADEECKVTLKAGEKVYWMLECYAEESSVQLGAGRPDENAQYKYNTLAVRFLEVRMDFSFVEESRPAQTNHVYSDFLTTKTYHYLLEADQDGRILGGEWIGESRKLHPDFAWWPKEGFGPRAETAGILFSDIKALNDEAAKR